MNDLQKTLIQKALDDLQVQLADFNLKLEEARATEAQMLDHISKTEQQIIELTDGLNESI